LEEHRHILDDDNVIELEEHRHILDNDNVDITNVYSDFTGDIELEEHRHILDNDKIKDIELEEHRNILDNDNDDITNVYSIETMKLPQLPHSLIRRVFSSFSNTKLSKTAMQVIIRSQIFFEQIATDLATYAAHGKREIIQDKD
ncbi:15781_t:CDS:2, partial [Racocetra persica]